MSKYLKSRKRKWTLEQDLELIRFKQVYRHSYAEIADHMGTTLAAVENRIRRIRNYDSSIDPNLYNNSVVQTYLNEFSRRYSKDPYPVNPEYDEHTDILEGLGYMLVGVGLLLVTAYFLFN